MKMWSDKIYNSKIPDDYPKLELSPEEMEETLENLIFSYSKFKEIYDHTKSESPTLSKKEIIEESKKYLNLKEFLCLDFLTTQTTLHYKLFHDYLIRVHLQKSIIGAISSNKTLLDLLQKAKGDNNEHQQISDFIKTQIATPFTGEYNEESVLHNFSDKHKGNVVNYVDLKQALGGPVQFIKNVLGYILHNRSESNIERSLQKRVSISDIYFSSYFLKKTISNKQLKLINRLLNTITDTKIRTLPDFGAPIAKPIRQDTNTDYSSNNTFKPLPFVFFQDAKKEFRSKPESEVWGPNKQD